MVEQLSFGKSAYAAVDGIKYNTQQIFQTPEREIMRGDNESIKRHRPRPKRQVP